MAFFQSVMEPHDRVIQDSSVICCHFSSCTFILERSFPHSLSFQVIRNTCATQACRNCHQGQKTQFFTWTERLSTASMGSTLRWVELQDSKIICAFQLGCTLSVAGPPSSLHALHALLPWSVSVAAAFGQCLQNQCAENMAVTVRVRRRPLSL